MTDPRKPVFDAIRAGLGRIEAAHVLIVDVALDRIGFPRAAGNAGAERARRTNDAGRALIREFEGCLLRAYPDPATGGAPWTIGYGHTGPEVKPGLTITQAEAEILLDNDIARFERAVADLAKVATDNQFAALVSLAFNIGESELKRSTLLRMHNEGDYVGAQGQFRRWSFAGGRQLTGLVRRRAAEAALYGTAA